MKEATGELNMTVITVVAIAAVGLLFTVFVWPNIQANLVLSTACSSINAHGNYETEDADITAGTDGYVICQDFVCEANYGGKTFTRECNSNP